MISAVSAYNTKPRQMITFKANAPASLQKAVGWTVGSTALGTAVLGGMVTGLIAKSANWANKAFGNLALRGIYILDKHVQAFEGLGDKVKRNIDDSKNLKIQIEDGPNPSATILKEGIDDMAESRKQATTFAEWKNAIRDSVQRMEEKAENLNQNHPTESSI